VEFQDDGSFADPSQVEAAENCITEVRRINENGALVVLFIHGWRCNARWDTSKYASAWDANADDDQHFRDFRRVLMGLALRESERYPTGKPGGRRVVGIYLGWNGVSPTDDSVLSFWDRYEIAELVGGGRPVREAIRTIVEKTKVPMKDRPESPLVLAGHSMGALVLEAAFLALLREPGDPLVKVFDPGDPSANEKPVVEVTLNGRPIAFPDLLLALNSAADSGLVREIIDEAHSRNLIKRLTAPEVDVDYAPPLLVSATSSADLATGIVWRAAKGFQHYTDGHDPNLRTHDLNVLGLHQCPALTSGWDFRQDWACLRFPVPRSQPTPSFAIDLPSVSRSAPGGPIHTRYQLEPRFPGESRLAWLFEVPPELVPDHNDIFNGRSRLFFMALMQISGAVMSLAQDVNRNFEVENAP
jgi:hypothetical protein